MYNLYGNKLFNIAMVFSVALLIYGCKDNYKRVGEEAQQTIYPQGVAQNFVLTYTETPEKLESEDTKESKVIAILKSPLSEDYDNMRFKFRTFPNGLEVDLFDAEDNK
ncbi:MAG: LPS export ABC transporter periplasmic protein LptC, partial [Eudoraea sp.]|nr:LPS export ABC transporter periplasmic protein LptC [Eudoraea sp.]